MMPSVYGCCDQQNNTSASIAITSVTFQTKSYGTTLAAGTNPIGVSDQITTVLNSSNSFTVPADGLAQYYSGSNTSQQVFHVMTVGYTLTGAVEQDLPPNGACEFAFKTSLNNTPANSQLNTWPLEGTTQGQFVPSNSKQTGVEITTTGLDRANVFPQSPILGYDVFPCTTIIDPGSENNNTDRLSKIAFAAQNLGSSSSFGLIIKLKLGDGSTVESPAQTITIPVGAVKTNLIAGVGINSFTTTAIAYGFQMGVDITNLAASEQLVSLLNSANSFTTPTANIGGLIGMAQGYNDPGNQVLHQYQFNLDTSLLTLSDYPATNLVTEFAFTIDADATGGWFDPDAGLLWDADTGSAITPTQSGSLYTYTGGGEYDGVNTNTLIPATPGDPAFTSIDFPIVATPTLDYSAAFKAYNIASTGVPTYTLSCVVKIQKTDGSFTTSSPLTLTIDSQNGVVPTIV